MKPVIGITMGDPAGIGPELILKAWRANRLHRICRPAVIGSVNVLQFYSKKLDLPVNFRFIKKIDDAEFQEGTIDILDNGFYISDVPAAGRISPECGNAAVQYTLEAGKLALEKKISAIVSAPLNKEAMRNAGYNYEGQTQILGELCGAERYGMILLLGPVRVMMLTTHIALREACDRVTEDRVSTMIELAHQTLQGFGIKKPRIAVAALNPHGGEGGLFGREEIEGSLPAIKKAEGRGIIVTGPVPADVVFLQAKQGEYDLVLAMYHDQANMAAKLLGFGEVVTVLAGLPIIRTSVGHGTAFDIAGKGIAKEGNFIRAIEAAADLAVLKGAEAP